MLSGKLRPKGNEAIPSKNSQQSKNPALTFESFQTRSYLVLNLFDGTLVVEYTIFPRHYGLFEEDIMIYNTHNMDKPLSLQLRLFVDENVIEVLDDTAQAQLELMDLNVIYLKPKKSESAIIQQISDGGQEGARVSEDIVKREKEERSLVTEKFKAEDSEEDAEEEQGEDEGEESEHQLLYEISDNYSGKVRKILLHNLSSHTICLRARTDLDFDLRWVSHAPQDSVAKPIQKSTSSTDLSEFSIGAGCWAALEVSLPQEQSLDVLNHHHSADIMNNIANSNSSIGTAHKTSSKFTLQHFAKGLKIPFAGKLISFRERTKGESCMFIFVHATAGNIFIERFTGRGLRLLRETVCVKLITVRGCYSLSLAKLDSQDVDAGTISDVWRALPFQFTLHNISDVPLVCSVLDLPPEIAIDRSLYSSDSFVDTTRWEKEEVTIYRNNIYRD